MKTSKKILIAVGIIVLCSALLVGATVLYKQSGISYKCPDTEWLDCMPGSPDGKYCAWVANNFPSQKIAY